jgi:hypothetical protein
MCRGCTAGWALAGFPDLVFYNGRAAPVDIWRVLQRYCLKSGLLMQDF